MGKDSDGYVRYVMARVEFLVGNGVKVMMVFDGGPLPSKEGTEVERASSRAAGKCLSPQSARTKDPPPLPPLTPAHVTFGQPERRPIGCSGKASTRTPARPS